MLFGLFLAAIVNPVVMGVIFFGIGAARFGEIHLVKKKPSPSVADVYWFWLHRFWPRLVK